MAILCSMPGRSGDIVWSLATVRAIAETYGEPVDLCISGKYGTLMGLIERQGYIRQVIVETDWRIEESAPITPRTPPMVRGLVGDTVNANYDRIFHLGYESWPTPNLAEDVYNRANSQFDAGGMLRGLDLHRPWIAAPLILPPQDISMGFTDEHFELKYGIYTLLLNRFVLADVHLPAESVQRRSIVWVGNSPRWQTEGGRPSVDWETAASWIAASQVFVGCCSALHVLAVALGKPVVCLEPNPHRHADVFWPMGKTGSVRLVLGGDALPTWDARHCGEAIEMVLQEQR